MYDMNVTQLHCLKLMKAKVRTMAEINFVRIELLVCLHFAPWPINKLHFYHVIKQFRASRVAAVGKTIGKPSSQLSVAAKIYFQRINRNFQSVL